MGHEAANQLIRGPRAAMRPISVYCGQRPQSASSLCLEAWIRYLVSSRNLVNLPYYFISRFYQIKRRINFSFLFVYLNFSCSWYNWADNLSRKNHFNGSVAWQIIQCAYTERNSIAEIMQINVMITSCMHYVWAYSEGMIS